MPTKKEKKQQRKEAWKHFLATEQSKHKDPLSTISSIPHAYYHYNPFVETYVLIPPPGIDPKTPYFK